MSLFKKVLLFIGSLVIGLALLIGVVQKVGWEEIIQSFFVFRWWKALIIVGLTLIRAFLAIWKYRKILKASGLDVSVRRIMPSFFSGFPLMFFAPEFLLSGDFLRGYALQKRKIYPGEKLLGR